MPTFTFYFNLVITKQLATTSRTHQFRKCQWKLFLSWRFKKGGLSSSIPSLHLLTPFLIFYWHVFLLNRSRHTNILGNWRCYETFFFSSERHSICIIYLPSKMWQVKIYSIDNADIIADSNISDKLSKW